MLLLITIVASVIDSGAALFAFFTSYADLSRPARRPIRVSQPQPMRPGSRFR